MSLNKITDTLALSDDYINNIYKIQCKYESGLYFLTVNSHKYEEETIKLRSLDDSSIIINKITSIQNILAKSHQIDLDILHFKLQNLEQIVQEIYNSPNMPGFLQAKNSFDSISKSSVN